MLAQIGSGPLAMADDDEWIGYESIINDLKGSTTTKIQPMDPFDSLWMHAGLGFATSHVQVRPENGKAAQGFLTGVEANFGIDLFSRVWQAETSLRSFNTESLSPDLRVALKEFDLKVMHTSTLSSKLKLRLGGGLAARYMKAHSHTTRFSEYTTPATILNAALRTQMTSTLGLSADVSLRNAMIAETVDRSALNASLRLDAQF